MTGTSGSPTHFTCLAFCVSIPQPLAPKGNRGNNVLSLHDPHGWLTDLTACLLVSGLSPLPWHWLTDLTACLPAAEVGRLSCPVIWRDTRVPGHVSHDISIMRDVVITTRRCHGNTDRAEGRKLIFTWKCQKNNRNCSPSVGVKGMFLNVEYHHI